MSYKLIFLILNYKSYKDTIIIANEILNFKPDFSFAIVIVDNNSPNDSFSVLNEQFKNINNVYTIQNHENSGFAKGNNFGLKWMNSLLPEYVCIINNDVHFELTAIEYLISIYPKLNNPGVIAPIQYLPNGKPAYFPNIENAPSFIQELKTYIPFSKLHYISYTSNTDFIDIKYVDIIPGAFMFIDYNNFKNINFFDEETFLYGEERILAKKIKENGMKNYIVLSQKYVHQHSKTVSSEVSELRQQLLMLKGKEIYFNKYFKMPKLKITILRVSFWLNYIFFRLPINLMLRLKHSINTHKLIVL